MPPAELAWWHHMQAQLPRAQNSSIWFNESFGSSMVLQQAPASACVYGLLGEGGTAATVTLSSALGARRSVAATVNGSGWKACLPPHAAGGDYNVSARCEGCTVPGVATLEHVTFGDVWYCGGQSNMALKMLHTFSRNVSRDKVLAGAYANIRIHGLHSNQLNPTQPWSTLRDALATAPDSDKSNFIWYSATCYYFGESLSDALAAAHGAAPPIGLVHTGWGGSTIEQWLDNATAAACTDAFDPAPKPQAWPGIWHAQRVLPYAGMTIKGWVWYQGENDMHGTFGNSARGSGYSCLMPKLVSSWRRLWAATPGTTDPLAPFGLVSLAPSGSEGGADIGTMRWAQTAGYGLLPNPAMPRTFLAHAYDLDDPYVNDTCLHVTKCTPTTPWPAGGYPGGCDGYCGSIVRTRFLSGAIHPRVKKPVGERLAQAALPVAYGVAGHSSGPTLAGCRKEGSLLTLTFNATLLDEGGVADALEVQPYARASGASKMHVLVNASLFCMQTTVDGQRCLDDGTGRAFNASGFDNISSTWVAVDVAVDPASPRTITVDLARSGGVAFGIRYAWQGDCCSENPPTSAPCPIASCPLMGSVSRLPANPFMARLVGDRCECVAPQTCDEGAVSP